MNIKTFELQGTALDWAVARCEGKERNWGKSRLKPYPMHCGQRYSIDWSQGGPIIERERIRIDCPWNPGPFEATCKIDGVTAWTKGPTVLIAAMRCYVASKLGDEVEVPDELC
jgi:hypothetical protein